MSNEASVSDVRKILKKELESKQLDIEKYKRYIKWQNSESIDTLYSQMSMEQTKLEACWGIQGLLDLFLFLCNTRICK